MFCVDVAVGENQGLLVTSKCIEVEVSCVESMDDFSSSPEPRFFVQEMPEVCFFIKLQMSAFVHIR